VKMMMMIMLWNKFENMMIMVMTTSYSFYILYTLGIIIMIMKDMVVGIQIGKKIV
jgi:hypothetical protein